ncbi:MAG: hypothetical protein ACPG7F_18975 [Aggregatilineales bacterium]
MGRVINTNSPGKRRNYQLRTIGELLRLLAQKQGVDDESRDMVATIIFALREVDATVIESMAAWEKRGYWSKASKFQMDWLWASQMAKKLETLLADDAWESLPDLMMQLFPHFSDMKINRMTRNADTWQGAYARLLDE